MNYLYLDKSDVHKFIESIMKTHAVMAPVKKENLFVFSEIDDPEEVCIEYMPTILPPKKYFMPQKETLGKFTFGKTEFDSSAVETRPTVIFGVHTCDIEGIECLDIIFNEEPRDPYFVKRKKDIIIIGYECMKPCDEHATCVTMDTHNPKAGYDMMITDSGEKYIVHVNSKAAQELIQACGFFKKSGNEEDLKSKLLRLRKDKMKNFTEKLDAKYNEINKVFKKTRESSVWEEVGKRCLSCGNCTAVCPTCYCFDIYDEPDLSMKEGSRKRTWDSCQLEEFAEVAGGENFREERSSRQRHRYYRKFDYPVAKYNKFFCVGCGRCTRTCMAKISLVETVND